MKIAIFSTNSPDRYSGGRYHGLMMAECLAYMGHDVSYVTNNRPIFYKDFETLPCHKSVKLFISKDFFTNLPTGRFDVVVIVPHISKVNDLYPRTRLFARTRGARLALINFESPNWFNAFSPTPRDERGWDDWAAVCEDGCLVLSSAKESQRWAEKFYTHYPERTHFDVWSPAINSLVADATPNSEKQKRIIVLTRLNDRHKGANDFFDFFTPAMQGFTLVFLIGSKDLDPDFKKAIYEAAHSVGAGVEFKHQLNDFAKFAEIKKASLMLFPSYFEGYGYPPVEALYCNTPCVAYELPVLRETCGQMVDCVERGDRNAFREKVEQILTHGLPEQRPLCAQVEPVADFKLQAKKIHEVMMRYVTETEPRPMPSTKSNGFVPPASARELSEPEETRPAAFARRIEISRYGVTPGGALMGCGWTQAPEEIDHVEVYLNGVAQGAALYGLERSDVTEKSDVYTNAHCGFGFLIPDFDHSATQTRVDIAIFSRGHLLYRRVFAWETAQLPSTAEQGHSLAPVMGLSEKKIDEHGMLMVRGFLLHEQAYNRVLVRVNGQLLGDAQCGLERGDLLKTHPDYKNTKAGFMLVDHAPLDAKQIRTVQIEAYRGVLPVEAFRVDSGLKTMPKPCPAPTTIEPTVPEKDCMGGVSECSVDDYDAITLRGWHLGKDKLERLVVSVNGERLGEAELNQPRLDVYEKHPEFDEPNSGFRFHLRVPGIETANARYRLEYYGGGKLVKVAEGRVEYKSRVGTGKCADYEYVNPGASDGDTRVPVVVFTHIQLLPCVQGNRVAIKQLIDWLRNRGERVFLVVQINPSVLTDYIDELTCMVDRLFIVDIAVPRKFRKARISNADRFYQGAEDCLIAIEKQYGMKAIIAEYIHMTTALELLPPRVVRLVQTIDIHSRFQQEVMPLGIEIEANRICTEEQEAELLRYADVIIAIQDHERELLEEMVPDRQTITVGLAADAFPRICPPSDPEGQNLLYVASRNPLNKRGIEVFLRECWGTVLEACPEAVLRIAGEVCGEIEDEFKNETAYPNVEYLGRVDNLDDLFDEATVVLNCTDLGTGLKIKSIEAIARGRAMVSTVAGVEGIHDYGEQPILVAEGWQDFSEKTIMLLGDPDLRRNIEASALRYRRDYLSYHFVYHELAEVIDGKFVDARTFVETEDPRARDLTYALLEAQHRIKIAGRLGVCITSDAMFSKYTAQWLKMHSLNICGLYTTNYRLHGKVFQGFEIKPLSAAAEDEIELMLLPSFELPEIEWLERRFWMAGVATRHFLPKPPFADRCRIKSMKDMHRGETAFILGNGPSVRGEDLDRLAGRVITFGANRFHMAYEKTKIRPHYTASADILMIEQHGHEIARKCGGVYFMQSRGYQHLVLPSDLDVIQYDIIPRPKGPPPQVAFTDDPSRGLGNGASIVFDLIQFAAWMGFKKIYLYGLDHTFSMPKNYEGKAGQAVVDNKEDNHFIKGYRSKSERWYSPVTEFIDKGFEVAREYCEGHGIEIYNATRGGRLEIFERRDFDDALAEIEASGSEVAPPAPPVEE